MDKILRKMPLIAAVLLISVSIIIMANAPRGYAKAPIKIGTIAPTVIEPSVVAVPVRVQPVQIRISAIGAIIPIIPVGVTPTGIIDTPHNFVQAGWYEGGISPGEIGGAVIDGHVDNGAGIDGVFKHLRDVRVGDEIAVTMSDGGVIGFRVIDSIAYPYAKVPMADIVHKSGAAYLSLITCHGTWNPETKAYDERLIVTAVSK